MVDVLSPLGSVYVPGSYGNRADGADVVLSEQQPGSIVQLAAWPGMEAEVLASAAQLVGLSEEVSTAPGTGIFGEGRAIFGIAPGRWLLTHDDEGLAASLSAAILAQSGVVTDLSHGRTAIRVSGAKAEWVLAKFFAIDFSREAFPIGAGRATAHHDIFAQIQRSGADSFDLYIFRSFARAFWKMLERACEYDGYEVR